MTAAALAACLSATPASAQDVPSKHLELAKAVVTGIRDEDNTYNFQKGRFVKLPGDLFSGDRYKVNTDCTGFVEAMLDRAYGITLRFGQRSINDRYSVRDWVYGIQHDETFTRIATINDLHAGDLVAWALLVRTKPGHTNGHVMIVREQPRRLKKSKIEGLVQWEIPIVDSSSSPTGRDDTRYIPDVTPKLARENREVADFRHPKSGAGFGKYYLYTNEVGEIQGITSGYNNPENIHRQGVDYQIEMARVRVVQTTR